MMRFRVTAPPTDEPIDLKMVRDTHLRGIPDDSSENDYLRQLIRAAREYCENYTGLSLRPQTLEALPDRLEKTMTLPRPPIRRIISVTVTRKDGSVETVPASAYRLDAGRSLLCFSGLPENVESPAITYEAGTLELPATVQQAILLLVGHWYDNREAVVVGSVTSVEVGMAVKNLLNQNKGWWF